MSVPIPNLPTDSIYKFIFVSGFALIIGSIVFLYQTGNIRPKIETTNYYNLELLLDNLMASPDSVAADTVKHQNGKRIWFQGVAVDSSTRWNKKVFGHWKPASFDLLYEREQRRIEKMNNFNRWAGGILGTVGFILTLWGGICWYRKIQMCQDELIKAQIELLKLEIEEKKVGMNRKGK